MEDFALNLAPAPIADVVNPCPGSLTGTPLTLFLALINSLYAAQCSLKPPVVKTCPLKNNDTFDYIVVGAGSAGCVIANRLTQNPNIKVLLLEAGDNPTVNSEIPGFSEDLIDSTSDWSFKTKPQENACLGFKDHVCRISAGKVLGGTSSIDSMVYLRGTRQDYEDLKNLNNSDWLWPNLLNTCKKLEKNYQFFNAYHGTLGELKVNATSYTHLFQNLVLNASYEMGFKRLIDPNGARRIGWGPVQTTIFEGKRMSAYKAFIVPIQNRPNLFIATKAYVTKILLDAANKTAYGVQVNINNKPLDILASKEVIISAGAINSPKLLMLSGLGFWEHLQQLGIHIIQNLPVGQNLQDHLSFLGFFVALKSDKCNVERESLLEAVYQYFQHSKGPLSSIGSDSFYGFINTIKTKKAHRFPNVQIKHIFFEKGVLASDPILIKRFRFDNITANKLLEENTKHPLIMFIPTLLYPKSFGHIKLSCANPFDPPHIYANYLTQEEDIKTFVDAILFLTQLTKTKAFKRCNAEIVDIKLPHCSAHRCGSDNYYRCSLKYLTTSASHVSGTVRMGLESDSRTVVNSRMQVRGIKNLRVVGNAIAPTIVSDADAGSSMMGELAAKFIKEFNSSN